MSEPTAGLGWTRHAWRPLAWLLLYYGALVVIYAIVVATVPWLADRLTNVALPVQTGLIDPSRVEPSTDSPAEAAAAAVLTMASAFLLVLPVVRVYTVARHKRGFQQSLAQTLLILPVVVAVVVILVKHSVALAFSLGGIVGAVAFRHRLEDTKDAVYIFATVAIGLAVGVQAYSVGFAASAFYNLVVIAIWMTDFARVPYQLTAEVAARRVQLAKDMVPDRRTGDYVAQLDQQLLQSMTPDQLKALADRALERKQEITQDYMDAATPDGLVTVVVAGTDSPDQIRGLRATLEAVLERDTKEWRFEGESIRSDGGASIRYRVRCRKRFPPLKLQDQIRRAVSPLTDEVSVQ